MAGNRFPRALRLKRRRLIRPLFEKSQRDVEFIRNGVILIRYRVVSRSDADADVPVQAGFAPGRAMRTKVARNRIRRVMREVFRLNQHGLMDIFDQRTDCLTLMIHFRGDEVMAADDIRRDLPEALGRLKASITSTS